MNECMCPCVRVSVCGRSRSCSVLLPGRHSADDRAEAERVLRRRADRDRWYARPPVRRSSLDHRHLAPATLQCSPRASLSGARFFASCLIFYEPLPPALAEKVEGYRPGKAIYMPKCIALFSHHPYYQLFRSILIETHLCFISSISRESASSSSQAPLRTRAGTALNDVRNSKNPRFLRSRSSRVGELSHASCPVEFIIRLITKEGACLCSCAPRTSCSAARSPTRSCAVPFPPPASEVSFTVGSTEFWFQTPCLDELPYSDVRALPLHSTPAQYTQSSSCCCCCCTGTFDVAVRHAWR